MNVYAESSAVLAWLLGEEAGESVRDLLRHADHVTASELTLVECDRVLIRAVQAREIDEGTAADRRARLSTAAAHWHLWQMTSEVLERARRPFPDEPVRTLDAIHLASALAARSLVPGTELLSLNERIRRAGKELGFRILPE